MKLMKAAVYEQYGPPEVVSIKELPIPVPHKDEILLKVHAASVNRTDAGFRSAEYSIIRLLHGLFSPQKKVLGCEFAGEVVQIGTDIKSVKIGDRLFGFNDSHWGGHAEFMILKEKDSFAEIPSNVDFIHAACICEGAHYALNNIQAANLKSGDSVMINGATGAIGSAAVQLCRHIGARVWATADTPNVELVKSLGADVVIDRLKEDFTKIDQRFDFVFDSVGKSTFGKCKEIMKPQGVYISTELGPKAENIWLGVLGKFSKSKRVLFPIPVMNKEIVKYLGKLVAEGHFKPVIDKQYSLSDIVSAYRYTDSGMKTGNLVLNMSL